MTDTAAAGSRSREHDVHFFTSPAEFRAWLERNHASEPELWVGYHKVATGKPSITWSESVDQALCFGWIDGVRRRLDEGAYEIRFTRRKPSSIWSAVNIDRVEDLKREGLMTPAGLRAFEARQEARSRVYAYERENAHLEPAQEAELRANEAAWSFWSAQPAWYGRVASHWVTSAKREETRRRRLDTLIADCAAGRRIRAVTLEKAER